MRKRAVKNQNIFKMNSLLASSMQENIVNFYCNIFGLNRNSIKKNEYKPIINIYCGNIIVYSG